MKKRVIIVFVFFISSGIYAQNNKMMSFDGEISNNKFDFIRIKTKQGKNIKISNEGIFSDTINVSKTGFYNMYYASNLFDIFLKNGYNLNMKMNAESYNSLVFSGKGSAENNFINKNSYFINPRYIDSLLILNRMDFLTELDKYKANLLNKLLQEDLESDFISIYKKYLSYNVEAYKKNYIKYEKRITAINELENNVLPSFKYDNYLGGKTKLKDFIGKYVYILVWNAGYNKDVVELKNLEVKFRSKNIVFISICRDSEKNFLKWKEVVKEKKLGGVQLFANENEKSKFGKLFGVFGLGLQEFFLIDENGIVTNKNVGKPSSLELEKVLSNLF